MKKTIVILKYIIWVHVFALITLMIFRTTLFICNISLIKDDSDVITNFFKAIFKGFRFDNVIICAILSLPLLVLTVMSLFNKISKILVKFFSLYIMIIFSIIFFNYAADIPYFKYFSSHISSMSLNALLNFSGDIKGMIFQESSYYFYILLFIVLSVYFCSKVIKLTKNLIKAKTDNLYRRDYKFYIPISLLVFIFYFIGIRGNFEERPISVSEAYFCNNSLYNKLGINPTFFLIKSISRNSKKNYLLGKFDIKKSIEYTRKQLDVNYEIPYIDDESPIIRLVDAKEKSTKTNVVIVLMESFSSEFLNWKYNGKSLTPYLHSLIEKSYYFENFYSAGVRTNNGIPGTLYSHVAQFGRAMMPTVPDYHFGIPMTLKQYDYQNVFFITGNPSFDNMASFLSENGFDKIYSEKNYPKEKLVNIYGISDDYLFEFGIDELNKIHRENKPFLATFLTVSNHPPIVVPEEYKNAGSNDQERIISFVDDSIKEFMKEAEKQDWYKNTIFVFLGDHGKNIGVQTYEMPLNQNHIPLIIYSELFDKPKKIKDFGGQVDVFPTIMGLLGVPYINNTMGVDLFKTKRPYIFFESDEYFGCIDDKFFYTYEVSTGKEGLYDYRNKNTENLISKYTDIADSMRTYSSSMILTSNYIVEKGLSRPSNNVIESFFNKKE